MLVPLDQNELGKEIPVYILYVIYIFKYLLCHKYLYIYIYIYITHTYIKPQNSIFKTLQTTPWFQFALKGNIKLESFYS